jgi:hypothetical protein
VRAARVLVAGPLNQREPPFVEDRLQAGEARMQPELVAGRIAADLKHLTGGNRQRRTACGVVRIAIRHDHAQGVVAAAQIQDDEIPEGRTLRTGDVAEEPRRGKSEAECRDAAAHEVTA